MEKLKVEQINNHFHLNKIRRDWEKIYQADTKSQIYCSWLWFKGWAERSESKWIVVTVKDSQSDTYIAFLPLHIENKKLFGINLIRRMYFAGNSISYYSGFLCLPEREFEIIEAISYHIQHNLNWDTFDMKWVRGPRIVDFVKHFSKSDYFISLVESYPSLIINLPDSYKLFLNHNLGRSTRRRTKEKVKNIGKNGRYRIAVSTDKSVNEDIEKLCRWWNNRWNKEHEIEWHRYFMQYFFNNKSLRLTTLWDDEKQKSIAALACFSDPVKKIYNAYLTSYDPEYSKLSPGIILFVDSIKHAIENNFRFYDLGAGQHPYKLSFGPQQLGTKNLHITRNRKRYLLLSKIIKLFKRIKNKITLKKKYVNPCNVYLFRKLWLLRN